MDTMTEPYSFGDTVFTTNLGSTIGGMARMRAGQKRKRVTVQDPSDYQQRSYYVDKTGRNKYTIGKVVRSNVTRLDYWFKALKTFDDNGFNPMNKLQDAAENLNFVPCYMFSPFHVNQSLATALPFRRLQQTLTNGQFSSRIVTGFGFTGASSGSLQFADNGRGVNVGNQFMGTAGLLKWTDFRFNLWGAVNKSVRFKIDFIRATKADCNPFATSVGTDFNSSLQQEFDQYIRPKTVNPISTANDLHSSNWKIVKSYTFDFDPIVTSEGDPDPHVKVVKLFQRWDREVRFDWSTASTIDPNANNFNDVLRNDNEQIYDVINTRPESEKDIFVLITATNYQPYSAVPFSNTTDGSFDISFRSSWARLSSAGA